MSEDKVINLSTINLDERGMGKLISGQRSSMRYWNEKKRDGKEMHANDYETLGFVLGGKAHLTLGSETVELKKGDSYLVPSGVEHKYTIDSEFESVEAITEAA